MNVALLLLTLFASSPATSGAELAVAWNREILSIAEEEDRFLTLKGVRAAAMMHLAMHDALNAAEPRFATWSQLEPVPDADPVVAAAHAAFTIAVDQYPDQEARFAGLLAANLDGSVSPEAGATGRALGERAARAVLADREGDAWNTEASYQWHPMAPGVYAEFSEHSGTPEGFVFGAGWAQARPFALEAADQFRAPPPPDIGSDAYTEAFDEVKEVGRHRSTSRTGDQSHLAMWWKDFVENSHNRLCRDLAIREGIDLHESARVFALLNVAVFDAYVSVFENKFFYNHWRPYTAIRWAEHDGNADTVADPDWDNLHGHTYAFPSYPSAHGCASAAAMTILADTFGPDLDFTMVTERVDRAGPLSEKVAMDPATRSFGSFAEAAMECSLSRVYLGIHFRYDSIEGYRLGERVGRQVLRNALLPNGDASAPDAD